ncbi:hypothetical protein SPRG_06413 [Saprolegnia parasitica CBS 223.65]|uniref:Myb-like domain-containing protein n=1 Tax=Saprolegnia parasitica (strain CBS 223.65) TaxID=695850 RepID=A0A067CH93_SAPPC|nr:hypothetical protein SPRG_06413 [Saprolegnia parasitica CBS 223.65]KDO28555.1 hypothetical protein SPRG_06413 [Saprolegnia parasitica CBS 223.65]|eukprot:XP_012200620.1 hypothetical protein SPRG_06413 [Saprolegnia parasitica CBS 223.65]
MQEPRGPSTVSAASTVGNEARWRREEMALLESIMQTSYPGWTETTAVDWTAVAAQVGSRDVWQCKQKWMRSLRPGLNLGPWSDQEDRLLMDVMAALPSPARIDWRQVAYDLEKSNFRRSMKQIKEHWEDHINPAIVPIHEVPLTKAELAIIRETVMAYPHSGKLWVLLIRNVNDVIRTNADVMAELLSGRGPGGQNLTPVRSKSDLKKSLQKMVTRIQKEQAALAPAPPSSDSTLFRKTTLWETPGRLSVKRRAKASSPAKRPAAPILEPAMNRGALLAPAIAAVHAASRAMGCSLDETLALLREAIAASAPDPPTTEVTTSFLRLPPAEPLRDADPRSDDLSPAQLLVGLRTSDPATIA